ESLQARHHLAREEAHVLLRLVPRHSGVAEDAVVRSGAGDAPNVQDLLVALLGRPPDLDAHEELDHRVGAALRRGDLLQATVALVAALVTEVIADELVM